MTKKAQEAAAAQDTVAAQDETVAPTPAGEPVEAATAVVTLSEGLVNEKFQLFQVNN